MSLPFVLFINGINDQGIVSVLGVGENNHLKYKGGGSCDVFRFLDSPDFEKQNIILDTNKHSVARIQRQPALIFNEISDADTHRVTLKKASQTLSQLTCPVLNHPNLILRTSRDQIYEQLKDIPGLIAPMTLRCVPNSPQDVLTEIAKSELNYPVIVRECGLHNGDKMVLLTHPDEIDELHAFAFDGREFYLIQFIDFQQVGVYSKLRIVVIDGRPYLRHARYCDHWNVHFRACYEFLNKNPQYYEKENHLLVHFETEILPLIESQIQAIYRKLNLDYFGIDCTLNAESHMQIFEVNASMHCLSTTDPDPTRYEVVIAKLKEAVVQMILNRENSENLE